MKQGNVYFLCIQSTYQDVQMAIYRNEIQCAECVIKKIDASADLIPTLDTLLRSIDLSLKNLSFIVANQGPAPFTTLRVVIASINGISFATGITLVGIDGIKALLDETAESSATPTIALLDAFSDDVYYAYRGGSEQVESGCMPILSLLQKLEKVFGPQKIRFVGSGAVRYNELLKDKLSGQAIVDDQITTCSLEKIAQLGLYRWKNKQDSGKMLLPLYLKKQWWQAKAS